MLKRECVFQGYDVVMKSSKYTTINNIYFQIIALALFIGLRLFYMPKNVLTYPLKKSKNTLQLCYPIRRKYSYQRRCPRQRQLSYSPLDRYVIGNAIETLWEDWIIWILWKYTHHCTNGIVDRVLTFFPLLLYSVCFIADTKTLSII